jgi:hypothetical protein
MVKMENVGSLVKAFLADVAAFFILIGSLLILWRNNFILLHVVLVECLVAFWFWHEPYDITFFLVISVFGTVAECLFVRFGIWKYSNPSFYGIPLWFPLAFGTTALIGQRLALTLTKVCARAQTIRGRGYNYFLTISLGANPKYVDKRGN